MCSSINIERERPIETAMIELALLCFLPSRHIAIAKLKLLVVCPSSAKICIILILIIRVIR